MKKDRALIMADLILRQELKSQLKGEDLASAPDDAPHAEAAAPVTRPWNTSGSPVCVSPGVPF